MLLCGRFGRNLTLPNNVTRFAVRINVTSLWVVIPFAPKIGSCLFEGKRNKEKGGVYYLFPFPFFLVAKVKSCFCSNGITTSLCEAINAGLANQGHALEIGIKREIEFKAAEAERDAPAKAPRMRPKDINGLADQLPPFDIALLLPVPAIATRRTIVTEHQKLVLVVILG